MASSSSKPSVKLGGAVKKIESPLAKYNNAGQLTCVICNVVVKSEMVWTAHINGRQHREQVLALKKPKSEPSFLKPQAAQAVKRKAGATSINEASNGSSPSPSKKVVPADFFDNQPPPGTVNAAPMPIKGILKNSAKPTPMLPFSHAVRKIKETPEADHEMETNEVKVANNQQSTAVSSTDDPNKLPEGFFDDPKLEAKVIKKNYNVI